MYQQLRAPERLFRLGQWVVAVMFAYFLIQVGSSLIADLPLVTTTPTFEQFVDTAKEKELEAALRPDEEKVNKVNTRLAFLAEQIYTARSDYGREKESFENWKEARKATERGDQNPEVVARAKSLDQLLRAQQKLEREQVAAQQELSELNEAMAPTRQAIRELHQSAETAFADAYRSASLKAFAIRLAFVLPVLIAALVVFRKYRKSSRWPFVWGFVIFALFAFFFELVPYLPSFGGYIRYGIGAVLTFWGGNALIRALQRYVERKQQEQAAPEEERKQDIRYEKALESIGRGQCPSCERAVPTVEGAHSNFCMHCGLNLFKTCSACGLRHNAFFPYCPSCGVHANAAASQQRGEATTLTGAVSP